MAFCGISFSDEKKENDEAGYHSLKNVFGFSTVQKQFDNNHSEGLLDIDEKGVAKDRRQKIDFSLDKFKVISFATLCQVAASVRNGVKGVGTCTRVEVNDITHMLTCAHNLVSRSTLTGRYIKHKSIFSYNKRQGEKAWADIYKMEQDNIHVHPKFNGEPSCGFDIAICAVSKETHEFSGRVSCMSKSKRDSGWAAVDPETIKVGYKMELGGYPGEKDGWPYSHTGKITHIKNTDEGGWILYYDSDSSLGMSGSPIRIVDERFVSQQNRRKGITKITVGVHTGHDIVEGLNYGTLITPALEKWMESK